MSYKVLAFAPWITHPFAGPMEKPIPMPVKQGVQMCNLNLENAKKGALVPESLSRFADQMEEVIPTNARLNVQGLVIREENANKIFSPNNFIYSFLFHE
jgi:hypothetical protein